MNTLSTATPKQTADVDLILNQLETLYGLVCEIKAKACSIKMPDSQKELEPKNPSEPSDASSMIKREIAAIKAVADVALNSLRSFV